ncbi:MAG: hypothetical protein J7545_23270 [Roseofilum sp. SBFL]|uniref:hypothetical protein n=1 Tax=unclassified Roseofilum TaxID=2620099 RepID=UPI001B206ECF|nr:MULTISPECIES: hypothetical protein [unclassified Roseofilum]MBP0015290.1 hypothetical protein [Roseofilum sp. SID3]MBP0024328.1 hypothetical protein [Roseofilum sp. SID2]MBP0036276.1 hypothetical protein [Roseofilum sp. SID1]MBP0044858.1 hypothetical protein [Roseofilum sp. SBFL]
MKIKKYWWVLILIQLTLLVVIINGKFAVSNDRPSLVYREDFREIPAAIPITQEHISHEDLMLNLYGSAKESLKKSHHENIVNDPYYLWSGRCSSNWAATFSHRQFLVDLRGVAKIRWRTKQSGFRRLHILLKLEDGTWLVSDRTQGASEDWKIGEFNLMDLEWYALSMETITEREKVSSVDLSRVDEIGITDLMRGGSSSASSRLDWIEVYGKPVERFNS